MRCGQVLSDLIPHACPHDIPSGPPISPVAIPPFLLASAAGLWAYHKTHDGQTAAIAAAIGAALGFTKLGTWVVKLALWCVLLYCLFYFFNT
jgi:hypothetical protein